MEPSPRLLSTRYVLLHVWTRPRVERYVLEYGPVAERLAAAELRQELGLVNSGAALYKFRLTHLAWCLYESGHQRSVRDILANIMSEGDIALPPINPGLRWWSPFERTIADGAHPAPL